jgi:cobalt-zinc-cadmium resistance protein CzcA
MLFAFIGMRQFGISGNLMSLGAIDFGLIVDGSVVMIENIVRHLSQRSEAVGEKLRVIREAGSEVARPIVFAVGIIIVVYLPILTLQGVEGKMFRPMALTVVFALIGSLILALTLMPILASLVFRGKLAEKETLLIRLVKRVYDPILQRVIRSPRITVTVAALLFASSMGLVPFMGAEFIPRLDEGAVALQAWRLPSVSLEESLQSTTMIESTLKQFPEVITVVSKTGRAEIATDPMGVEISDIYVILKPPDQWQTARTKEELIARFDETLEKNVPGNIFSYSQPIELRVQELIAGVRSDVAIQIYGDDLEELKHFGDDVVNVLRTVPGAADVRAEQVAGLPYLRVIIDRRAIARYGINASHVLDVVRSIGGRVVGQILEGQKRFFFQVRFQEEDRTDLARISNLKVADPRGRLIPLTQLATLITEEGPAQISRENIHRRLAVEANVRGQDLASFVADAQRAVEAQVNLPVGYWIEWGGQFENLQRASRRLAIVVPIALLLIFVLLYSSFNSAKLAALIYVNVPIAATGGIFALFLRGMPFSISAGVGFIALFGVAVLNGVVLVSYINQLRQQGASAGNAAYEGALIRLRPVLMTALVASLGFVPMAVATSAGAEVQRPLATVVIGGLITSTLLTLLVLPAIYSWFEEKGANV